MIETDAPAISMRDLSFSYAVAEGVPANAPVFDHASLEVPRGAFALLTGDTGSGKTTLLRLAKPEVAPAGVLRGTVEVLGRDVRTLDPAESAQLVGYVLQSPDNQIVCDTVWHEMAFGLENVGLPQAEMRRRVAETCYFFGMESWLHRPCAELSGGQRQMLALASTLAMRPGLLLLDEPTSMLDPVARRPSSRFSSVRTASWASPWSWPRIRPGPWGVLVCHGAFEWRAARWRGSRSRACPRCPCWAVARRSTVRRVSPR